jgi:VWFA-related protein
VRPRPLVAVAACVAAAAAVVSATALPARIDVEPGQRSSMPAYGARVEVVRLHAAVLGDDGPVTDLTAEDFIVVDNEVEHEVALALSPARTPIDVVLAFDQSDSIRQAAPTVKRDARAFLDALGPDDCAFVLPFQHRVGPGVWGPSMSPTLLEIIDLTPLEGGTSLNDALLVGLSEAQAWNVPDVLAERVITEYEQPTIEGGVGIDFGADARPAAEAAPPAPGFDRSDLPFRVFASGYGCGNAAGTENDRRRALVVLSDGVDTTSMHTFGELLAFVYRSDVPVFPVVIGNPGGDAPGVNRDMQRAARTAERRLETLAEVTGGRLVRGSGSENRLREAYDEIVTILRGSYLLGYYPLRSAAAASAAEHEHEVEVKVRRPGVEVYARSEYHRASSGTTAARVALRRGAGLVLDGALAEALAAARVAQAADAELWDGYFLEAAVHWLQGHPRAALQPLQRALSLAPGVASAHFLSWQLHYDLGEYEEAWKQAIHAQIAGADMDEPMRMLAERAAGPADRETRLLVPRVFVEGPRGDDPAAYQRLRELSRVLSRAASASPYLGLVRDPLAADYYLYVDAEDVDGRRPRRLESRLELYNYTDQRLWREEMDVDDLDDPDQVAAAVAATMARLEEWLLEDR